LISFFGWFFSFILFERFISRCFLSDCFISLVFFLRVFFGVLLGLDFEFILNLRELLGLFFPALAFLGPGFVLNERVLPTVFGDLRVNFYFLYGLAYFF
jgi:hypothetical protein